MVISTLLSKYFETYFECPLLMAVATLSSISRLENTANGEERSNTNNILMPGELIVDLVYSLIIKNIANRQLTEISIKNMILGTISSLFRVIFDEYFQSI